MKGLLILSVICTIWKISTVLSEGVSILSLKERDQQVQVRGGATIRNQNPIHMVKHVSPTLSKTDSCKDKECMGKLEFDSELHLRLGSSLEFEYTPINDPAALPAKGRIFIPRLNSRVPLSFIYNHPTSDFCDLFTDERDHARYTASSEAGRGDMLKYCYSSAGEKNGSGVIDIQKTTFRFKTWQEVDLAKKLTCGKWTSEPLNLRVARMPVPSTHEGISVFSTDSETILDGDICIELDKVHCTSIQGTRDQTISITNLPFFNFTMVSVRTPKQVEKGSLAFWYTLNSDKSIKISSQHWLPYQASGTPAVKGSVGEFQTACFLEKFDLTCGLNSYDFLGELRTEVSNPSSSDINSMHHMIHPELRSSCEWIDYSNGVYRGKNLVIMAPYEGLDFNDAFSIPRGGTCDAVSKEEPNFWWIAVLVALLIGAIVGGVVGGLAGYAATHECVVPREVFKPSERILKIYENLEPAETHFGGWGANYPKDLKMTDKRVGISTEFNLTNYEDQIVQIKFFSEKYRLTFIEKFGKIDAFRVTKCRLVRYGQGSSCDIQVSYTGSPAPVSISGNVIWLISSIDIKPGDNTFVVAFRCPGVKNVVPRLCLQYKTTNASCADSESTDIIDQKTGNDTGYDEGDSNGNKDGNHGGSTIDYLTTNTAFAAVWFIVIILGSIWCLILLGTSYKWGSALGVVLCFNPAEAASELAKGEVIDVITLCGLGVIGLLAILALIITHQIRRANRRMVDTQFSQEDEISRLRSKLRCMENKVELIKIKFRELDPILKSEMTKKVNDCILPTFEGEDRWNMPSDPWGEIKFEDNMRRYNEDVERRMATKAKIGASSKLLNLLTMLLMLFSICSGANVSCGGGGSYTWFEQRLSDCENFPTHNFFSCITLSGSDCKHAIFMRNIATVNSSCPSMNNCLYSRMNFVKGAPTNFEETHSISQGNCIYDILLDVNDYSYEGPTWTLQCGNVQIVQTVYTNSPALSPIGADCYYRSECVPPTNPPFTTTTSMPLVNGSVDNVFDTLLKDPDTVGKKMMKDIIAWKQADSRPLNRKRRRRSTSFSALDYLSLQTDTHVVLDRWTANLAVAYTDKTMSCLIIDSADVGACTDHMMENLESHLGISIKESIPGDTEINEFIAKAGTSAMIESWFSAYKTTSVFEVYDSQGSPSQRPPTILLKSGEDYLPLWNVCPTASSTSNPQTPLLNWIQFNLTVGAVRPFSIMRIKWDTTCPSCIHCGESQYPFFAFGIISETTIPGTVIDLARLKSEILSFRSNHPDAEMVLQTTVLGDRLFRSLQGHHHNKEKKEWQSWIWAISGEPNINPQGGGATITRLIPSTGVTTSPMYGVLAVSSPGRVTQEAMDSFEQAVNDMIKNTLVVSGQVKFDLDTTGWYNESSVSLMSVVMITCVGRCELTLTVNGTASHVILDGTQKIQPISNCNSYNSIVKQGTEEHFAQIGRGSISCTVLKYKKDTLSDGGILTNFIGFCDSDLLISGATCDYHGLTKHESDSTGLIYDKPYKIRKSTYSTKIYILADDLSECKGKPVFDGINVVVGSSCAVMSNEGRRGFVKSMAGETPLIHPHVGGMVNYHSSSDNVGQYQMTPNEVSCKSFSEAYECLRVYQYGSWLAMYLIWIIPLIISIAITILWIYGKTLMNKRSRSYIEHVLNRTIEGSDVADKEWEHVHKIKNKKIRNDAFKSIIKKNDLREETKKTIKDMLEISDWEEKMKEKTEMDMKSKNMSRTERLKNWMSEKFDKIMPNPKDAMSEKEKIVTGAEVKVEIPKNKEQKEMEAVERLKKAGEGLKNKERDLFLRK